LCQDPRFKHSFDLADLVGMCLVKIRQFSQHFCLNLSRQAGHDLRCAIGGQARNHQSDRLRMFSLQQRRQSRDFRFIQEAKRLWGVARCRRIGTVVA